MDYNKITDNPEVVKLLKQRIDIEKQIMEIDKMALAKYEIEYLTLEEEQLITPIISIRTFENECKLYVDTETDEWVFDYKGVTKKRSKSLFECLIAKKTLQKELGV